jgi:hypothetical protein
VSGHAKKRPGNGEAPSTVVSIIFLRTAVFFLDLISVTLQEIKSQSKKQRQTTTVFGSGGCVNAWEEVVVLAIICD